MTQEALQKTQPVMTAFGSQKSSIMFLFWPHQSRWVFYIGKASENKHGPHDTPNDALEVRILRVLGIFRFDGIVELAVSSTLATISSLLYSTAYSD